MKILPNLKLSHLLLLRNLRAINTFSASPALVEIKTEREDKKFEPIVQKLGSKIVYNCILFKSKGGFVKEKIIQDNEKLLKLKQQSESPLPVSLKYFIDTNDFREEEREEQPPINDDGNSKNILHFPYYKHNIDAIDAMETDDVGKNTKDIAEIANEEVRRRNEMKNWMTAYDNYDDTIVHDESAEWKINYGTADSSTKISNVPCGGCGAPLHCKDTALPGYIPSEIFKNCNAKGATNLQAIICQRCYFLKHHNLALQMRVSPDDYPKVLSTIRKKHGMVVLIVDLLDLPCSIWPGIADIFGRRTPIVVVGNKVDLLPKDNRKYLERIKKILLECVRLSGFAMCNIKHVALISAKTGYGIEDLITGMHTFFEREGDVYLVGCTNVGKSSLFNALLQSDYCKIQAIDLIQRATTSVWPGTTLNLLKFPIKRPVGYRQYLRHQRLLRQKTVEKEVHRLRQDQLRTTKDPKYATLIGHIEVTRNNNSLLDGQISESKDIFHIQGHSDASGKDKMGINENALDYIHGKWCYDTPGVVQPDQIIHLLTTEELLITLPKALIVPRTFCVKPEHSLYIGGLSRLDYVEGPGSIRLTVFCSNDLPITVCKIDDADEVYRELLGSDLFKVPIKNVERIVKWPGLKMAKEFTVIGNGPNYSCNDIVLSSAGWVAITGFMGRRLNFKAWTPEKRGVYIRDCLLPYAVKLRGPRIKHSIAYNKSRFYLE